MDDEPTIGGLPEPDEPGVPGSEAVLYLDVDDEITSAAARIRATEAERIALVLPFGSRLATSRINFRLLAREATNRGRRVEIVAPDASARALAASAGLTVHASVAGYEGRLTGAEAVAAGAIAAGAEAGATAGAAPALPEPVPAGDGTETRVITVPRPGLKVPVVGRDRPLVRPGLAIGAVAALVAVIVVGALGALLLLPSATITLAPRSEEIGPLALVVEARPDVTAPDAETLTVPARDYTFPAAASQTFTTAGVKVVDTAATGTVKFSNLDTGASNTIPSGSIVKTQSGIEFRTLATVNLPPASIAFDGHQFIVVPSTSSVGVEAVAAGPEGNVPAGAIIVVPKGENEKRTIVTNPAATTGGAHNESPQISQEDVDAALAALATAVQADFDAKVTAAEGVPTGTTLFDETKVLGEITPSVDPATLVGQEVATFDLGVTASGTVLGVDPGPVRSVAEARLRARVPDGWRLDEPSIHIEVGEPTVIGDLVSFPVTATATRVRLVDQAALQAQVKGLVLAEARAKLDDYGDVTIVLWPDWVTTIPTNDGRINFTLGDPAPLETPGPSGGPAPTSP